MDNFQREVLWLLHTICANTSSDESSKKEHLDRADAYFKGITSFYTEFDEELSEETQNME